MALAQPTSLGRFSICGTIASVCDDAPRNLRVEVTLLNPGVGRIQDPTNCSTIKPGLVERKTIVASTDGCWCTCGLFPNYAADPDAALQPNTTAYHLQVFCGSTLVVDHTFQIDADTYATLPTVDSECGQCIDICEIDGPIPQLPPPPTFCEVVEACVADDLADLQAQIDAIEQSDCGHIGVGTDPATGFCVIATSTPDGVTYAFPDGSPFTGDPLTIT